MTQGSWEILKIMARYHVLTQYMQSTVCTVYLHTIPVKYTIN